MNLPGMSFSLPEESNNNIYFSSTNPKTIIKIKTPVIIKGMDEGTLYFQCERELPMYTVFHISFPVKALLTIVPVEEGNSFKADATIYKGLINFSSEKETQELRFKINEILFEEKKQAKKEEQELFEQSKKDFIANKQQTEKEAEEEKIKEAQEKKEKEEKEAKEKAEQAEIAKTELEEENK
jgi:hypothetical protein